MLTIGDFKSTEGLDRYFDDHLTSGDYHSDGNEIAGYWLGSQLPRFGLAPEMRVKREDFLALINNIHPRTGEQITPRQKANRRPAYDLVFSAPKSVSIMALTMGDERLIAAHEAAVRVAFLHVEKFAKTRLRKDLPNTSDQNRTTGNLTSAVFTHHESRELDPQLHTHLVTMNMTYDPVEGRFKAVQMREIYDKTKYFTAIYRNDLAARVRALGYEIESTSQGWKIIGVAETIEKLFSKRSEDIKRIIKEVETEKKIKIGNKGKALIAKLSRKPKKQGRSKRELLEAQLAQLSPEELGELLNLLREALKKSGSSTKGNQSLNPNEKELKNAIRSVVTTAIQHIFERNSVITKTELLTYVLERCAGSATFEEIESELKSGAYVIRGEWITTKIERRREAEILAAVKIAPKMAPIGRTKIQTSPTLTSEQKTAVDGILLSTHQYTILRGRAGTGKTFTIKEIVKNSSLPVVALGSTTSATETLKLDGFEARTLASLLLSQERNNAKPFEPSLIILDEAGFVSNADLKRLFSVAKKTGSRVLMVGDTTQHNSVAAGDSLRLLETFSQVPSFSLNQIQRQKDPIYRSAVKAISEGKTEAALQSFEKSGVFHEIAQQKWNDEDQKIETRKEADEKRAAAVAKDFLEHVKKGEDTLVITPTWAEHARVSAAIRTNLKENNRLSKKEFNLEIERPAGLSDSEKKWNGSYRTGERIRFHEKWYAFSPGDAVTVVERRANGKLLVETKDQKKIELDPARAAHKFEVFLKEQRDFSRGDQIMIKRNLDLNGKRILTNGSRHKISEVDRDGVIKLENGVTIPKEFRTFTHGYAVTSIAAQGMTADHEILSTSARNAQALSRQQFYVSISRGRMSISIYTDDKERFREAVSKDSAREFAIRKIVHNSIYEDRIRKVKTKKGIDITADLINSAVERGIRIERERRKQTRERDRQWFHRDEDRNFRSRQQKENINRNKGAEFWREL